MQGPHRPPSRRKRLAVPALRHKRRRVNMEACPLPQPAPQGEEAIIQRMLKGKRIAVVGLSHDPSRASNFVAKYLQSAGYEIIPVNPAYEEVIGLRCYPN